MKNKEAKSIFSSLENFSSIPPPELWDNIEAQLDQPKKKKRAIIWWSIAASLLVGLSVPTILYFKSNQANGFEINIENDVNSVVLQKDSKGNDDRNVNHKRTSNANRNVNETDKNNQEDNGIANTNVKINERENSLNGNENANDKSSNSNNSKLNNNRIHLNNTNEVAEATVLSTSSKTKENISLKNLNSRKNNEKNSIAKVESKVGSKKNVVVANQNLPFVISRSKLINAKDVQANNSNTNNKVVVSNETNAISGSNINKVVFKSFKDSGFNVNNKSVVSSEKNIISESNVNKVVATKEIPKSVQANNSNTNNKSVASNETNVISGSNVNNGKVTNTSSKDSLGKIKMEVARLENVLVELEKDKKDKKKSDPESIDKWSLQVFAGVMSSQNYNNEKALGNTVASKQSNGYGVKTNYKLNKKWGVSSGFKINELGQKIAGVSYYEQQSRSGILMDKLPVASDNYSSSTSKNSYNLVSMSKDEGYLFASNSDAENGFEKGDVTQNLKYFEMPVEVSYALLSKKKTNITMNTGGFVGKLISNDIALNGNSIGENKNVNQYVYGTVLSSTLQYEFYKKTKFFVEPGMNYYINPLENQSFNQFQWMFNVGLNVSF